MSYVQIDDALIDAAVRALEAAERAGFTVVTAGLALAGRLQRGRRLLESERQTHLPAGSFSRYHGYVPNLFRFSSLANLDLKRPRGEYNCIRFMARRSGATA